MMKGLRPGLATQYFARKPPQSIDKLLQKMDEYMREDNDFHQRREEAQRYAKMNIEYKGRFDPKYIKNIHNSS
jgi:hypothetical protein